MSRPAEVPGKPAKHRVDVLMNQEMRDWVDGARGEKSRASFIRSLIRAEAGRRKAGVLVAAVPSLPAVVPSNAQVAPQMIGPVDAMFRQVSGDPRLGAL